jgi:hypothetical protein
MMRQMEFDADRFESQWREAKRSPRRRGTFNCSTQAWQQTIAQQTEAYATNRLVNDLPRLSAMAAKRLAHEGGSNKPLCASNSEDGLV